MSEYWSYYPMIEWIKNSRLFNTSEGLMETLYEFLSECSFVHNLAIVVKGARSKVPTFSLIFFWNPKFLNEGYVTLVSNKPLTEIRNHLMVIQKNKTLTGYFDVTFMRIHMVAEQGND